MTLYLLICCLPEMKKTITIFIVVVLMAMLCVLSSEALTKDLIRLDDGRIIEVDACWVVGDQVFSQSGDFFEIHARHQVLDMASGFPTDLAQLRLRFDYLSARGFSFRLESLDKKSLNVLGATLVLALLFFLSVRFMRRFVRRWKQAGGRKPSSLGGTIHDSDGKACPRLAGLADVEKHFLEIFRCQLGAGSAAQARIKPLKAKPGYRGGVYRLEVFHDGEWRQRRMSISLLGEGTSSKSQCFYVIYDTHLVIKIPPVPIADFSDYRKRLGQEASVARRLGERPCIIPNVTAILSRIHRFDPPETDPERLETRYLHWLAADPANQRHLRIAGSFAFFMDMSRYMFLSYIMAQLGDVPARLAEVVREDIELVDSPERVEEKYGEVQGPIGFEIQTLFAVVADRLQGLTGRREEFAAVTDSEKQEWLLRRMAGLFPLTGQDGSQSMPEWLARLFDGLMVDHRSTAHAYRRLVNNEAQRRAFGQAMPRMVGLATNMLELMVWLGQSCVAMRDLKPDNLLVAGDPKQYPHFLSDPERFAIGLIDVETAVVYPETSKGRFDQPQLGGTPPYATPSHFFPNSVLKNACGDLGRVLHFQDWYAVIAIIFEIVTGRRLFIQTAAMVPDLILAIRQRKTSGKSPQALFDEFSQQFWVTARDELHRRIAGDAARLEAVTVILPDGLHEDLAAYLSARRKALDRQIEETLASHDLIVDESHRKELAHSDMAAFRKLMSRYQKQRSPAAEGLLSVLFALVPLKQAQEEEVRLDQALSRDPVRITVKDLIPLMFDMIESVMRPAEAPAESTPSEPASVPSADAKESGTLGFTYSVSEPPPD